MAENGNGNALVGRTVLVVNTGSPKKRFIVQRLKKMGLRVVMLNKEKNWAQPYVDHWILADNTNHLEAIQAVQQFMAQNPHVQIEGAVTFWEDDVLLTSRIIDRFGWIGIPYNIALKVRNKFMFRQFCSDNRIPAPRFHITKGTDDLEEVIAKMEFPLVLKPAFGSSSAYVMKVHNRQELLDTYRFITSAISPNVESALTDGLDLFIEEYLDGDEVDIDVLIQNGKIKFTSIADNYNKDKGTFFQDSGQAIPSSLPEKAQEELLELMEETLERLGIQNGLIHFEGKFTKKGAFPIEINMRMGGDYVYSYTKDAWGVDLIEYAVKIALGEYIKIPPLELPKKYIVGWDLHPEDSGVLVELDVEETLEKEKFVEEVQFYKEVGDPVLVPPEGFENLGWLTVSGENLLDAQDNLEKALEQISFKVVEFETTSSLGKTERKDRFSSAVLNKNILLRMAKMEIIKKTNLENVKNLPIGLLCNVNTATDNPVEARLAATPFEIEKTLKEKGYNVNVLNANDIPTTVGKLLKDNIDLVFNIGIGEKFHNAPKYKPHMASLLDLLQIPYTGSDPFTLFLAFDKIRFKKILSYHDIPTPRWDYMYSMDDKLDEELEYPLVVKPATAIHSLGITNHSVVTTPQALHHQLEFILKTMGIPALVEEYIEGDEYEAYILGNDEGNLQVLPLRRSIFDNMPAGQWHLYTSDAKFIEPEQNNQILRQLPPKNISKKLLSLLTEIALDTYSIFGCKDYGKVKIKTDKDGNPYVLELNPNPSLNRDFGFASAAKLVDMDYGALLEEIIYLAVVRYKQQPLLP
jgi:D-alanine--D-alanine ligase